MSFARALKQKAPSLIVVWLTGVTLIAGLAAFAGPARAANCSRSGAPTPGDWNIGAFDNEVCTGITIVMDGNLNIAGTGSLTLTNGGLKFVEDTTHTYAIAVSAGGSLTLTGSTVWTEPKLVNPYLKLDVTISGTLTAVGSTFAFPGTIASTSGATVTLSQGSLITRTATDVHKVFFSASGKSAAEEDNDDAPGLTFDGSLVNFYASRVDSLYENNQTGFLGDPRQSIRLTGGTTFTAIDTFLGVDFASTLFGVFLKNNLTLAGGSNAYLYGVSVDTSENPLTQDQYTPAIVAVAGTRADLYRWADVVVVDSNSVPVPGATVTADFTGSQTGPATFRDNGNGNDPPIAILNYMGKTAGTWRVTGADGIAHMPLLSDWIDSTTMPNSRFVGAFALTATWAPHVGTGSVTFSAYPAFDLADASKAVQVMMPPPGFASPPDLTPTQPTFTPAIPKAGQSVQIRVPIANLGAGGAANILVWISDGVTRLANVTIPVISPFPQAGYIRNVSTTLTNATAGQHVIRVFVDPNNVIYEGVAGSTTETNNLRGFPLQVTPLGPDLAADVSFNPDPGFLNNPVALQAGITNVGDTNASNVQVNFYVQNDVPTAGSSPVGIATIPTVNISASVSVTWTPTALGDYTVWAWADPDNLIPEPPPYLKSNNLRSAILHVNPAPDLVTMPNDLTMTDPYPRVGQLGDAIEAVVRNAGQANTSGFQNDFFVDGNFLGTRTNAAGVVYGAKWVPPPMPLAAPFATCGAHTIGINVDAQNSVIEGSLYEQNNNVTSTIQVYPPQVLTWGGPPRTIDADQAFASNLEITGTVTITNAHIAMIQDQAPCGRYYVKVLAGGNLILSNVTLTSNWPLVVFVATGGTLTATDSTFNLDVQGKGALYSRGSLTLTRSTVLGDVTARGTSATLRRDTFGGSLLHVDTTTTSRLWDSTFPGVSELELVSDITPKVAPDFDIRNVTFSAALTAQLVFSGTQWASLTSVSLTKAGDWWTGMLAQTAHVTRYWWLTVETVDGTGTRIVDPTTSVDVRRFNPVTTAWDPAPPCAVDECYFYSNMTAPSGWMVGIPTGKLLYRAASEDRYGPLGAQPSVRATYRADGWAFIESQVRKPDRLVSAVATANATITLTFSALTPDLTVTRLAFNGDNGANVDSQPIAHPLTLQATVKNLGQIVTRNVMLYFYSVDIDASPRDGVMDGTPDFFVNSLIGQAGPLNVSAGGFTNFTLVWSPPGTFEGSVTVSAVVDPNNAVKELAENNNLEVRTLTAFTWPDLHFTSAPVTGTNPAVPIVNNPVILEITVTNEGTAVATSASFSVWLTDNSTLIGSAVTKTVQRGETTKVFVTWTPTVPGPQTIRIRVIAAGAIQPGDYHNYDFDLSDNFADALFDVRTQPDLSIAPRGTPPSPFKGAAFNLNVTLDNTGQTTATGVVVAIWDSVAPGTWLGALYNQTIAPGQLQVSVHASTGLQILGSHDLIVKIDANNTVVEVNEANNQATITINVLAPFGSIQLQNPSGAESFQPGQTIAVFGRVIQTDGTPIGGVRVNASLRVSGSSTDIPNTFATSLSAANSGFFLLNVTVPASLAEGTYSLHIESADRSISGIDLALPIAVQKGFFETSFLGLPVWIWLIVIIGAAAAIGGGTAYVKFVGLGKLVECGECGSFIPEDSTKCPKCGVEFEKDMAKCSNCQAWIPVDVKQCPECGVEFATGEVEMADYEAQMRRQYDEVKRKFRDEAGRELGRSLSEREFEDWWRTQPTFVTFEDWLREEEDMRRMGSKPCPVCNTLNSVTATVCHKCGTLLKEEPRRKGGAPPAPARAAPPVAAPVTRAPPEEAASEGGPGMPSEAIPKKVVKKPIVGAPVVQKKVIRRPIEEQKEGEGGTGSSGGDEGEQI